MLCKQWRRIVKDRRRHFGRICCSERLNRKAVLLVAYVDGVLRKGFLPGASPVVFLIKVTVGATAIFVAC